jgi:hypothetical protein
MKFKSYLADKDFSDLVTLWNEYASEQDPDSMIYESVEDLAELLGDNGTELARRVFFGDLKNWYDRVYLNGYGNIESCWNVANSPIDVDLLADWLKEQEHEAYEEWKESLPPFAEWLSDNLTKAELVGLWKEYIDTEDELDLDALAEALEDDDAEVYKDYLKDMEELAE